MRRWIADRKVATLLTGYNALNVSGFRHLRINHSKLFCR